MATSTRETLGGQTARTGGSGGGRKGARQHREVSPGNTKGLDQIGEKAVVVPTIGRTRPSATDLMRSHTSPNLSDVTLDDQHAQNEGDVIRLVAVAAASLGAVEDQEIIWGGGAEAALLPGAGRVARNRALKRSATELDAPPVRITHAGPRPTGDELYEAISNAVAALETANRPGQYGLLVHNNLMATLRQPRHPWRCAIDSGSRRIDRNEQRSAALVRLTGKSPKAMSAGFCSG